MWHGIAPEVPELYSKGWGYHFMYILTLLMNCISHLLWNLGSLFADIILLHIVCWWFHFWCPRRTSAYINTNVLRDVHSLQKVHEMNAFEGIHVQLICLVQLLLYIKLNITFIIFIKIVNCKNTLYVMWNIGLTKIYMFHFIRFYQTPWRLKYIKY
jgi:hypothetical protein